MRLDEHSLRDARFRSLGTSWLDVVTLLIPRAEHWVDYLPLLEWQRRSAWQFGHGHTVITEGAPWQLNGYTTLAAKMGDSLMHAILEGQIAYLEQWSGEHPIVMLDVDCLVNRNLRDVFIGERFDIGVTSRPGAACPINNGAIYIAAGAKRHAIKLFTKALSLCLAHWGGDQEAMAQACAPVPENFCVEERHGARIAFMEMKHYNNPPKIRHETYNPTPFVLHFKGGTKEWMGAYAKSFLA